MAGMSNSIETIGSGAKEMPLYNIDKVTRKAAEESRGLKLDSGRNKFFSQSKGLLSLESIREVEKRQESAPELSLLERALKEGDKGEKVLKVQKVLNRYSRETGIKLEENGAFDSRMTEAVKAFQVKKGLGIDGVVGNVTYGTMWAGAFWNDPKFDQILCSNEFLKDCKSRNLKLEVDLTNQRLFLKDADTNKVLRKYPVSSGAPGFSTPSGSYTTSNPDEEPSWYPPKSPWAEGASVEPPGPNNPLGPVCIPLAQNPNILLHGIPTSKFDCLGNYPASHGCIRMFPHDVWELHKIIEKGTPVNIRY